MEFKSGRIYSEKEAQTISEKDKHMDYEERHDIQINRTKDRKSRKSIKGGEFSFAQPFITLISASLPVVEFTLRICVFGHSGN